MSVIATQFCSRLHGGSVCDCACRLPDEAGWLECPPEARGVLVEAEPVVLSAQSTPAEAPRAPRPAMMAGEFCHSCGSPNMIRTGTCMTCAECGDSSGGCS